MSGNDDRLTAHISPHASGFLSLCVKMADRRRRRRRASQDSEDDDESVSGSDSVRSGSSGGKNRPRAPEPGETPANRPGAKSEAESECVSTELLCGSCYHLVWGHY